MADALSSGSALRLPMLTQLLKSELGCSLQFIPHLYKNKDKSCLWCKGHTNNFPKVNALVEIRESWILSQ